MRRLMPTASHLHNKLVHDEEWLRDFQNTLKRNSALTNSISSILDDFRYRITSLSNNVSSLYSKTSVVQQEQQNVKKLLGIVDATIQFHGKTMDFENTIHDRNLLQNLTEYLEKMNDLKEAVAFFSTHATYQSQYNHMEQIFQTGCENLETEFANFVRFRSVSIEVARLFELLDEEYDISDAQLSNLVTLRDTETLAQIARWIVENTNRRKILEHYAMCRAENMIRTQRSIAEQAPTFVFGDSEAGTTSIRSGKKKTQLIKTALKKAASKIGDKTADSQKDQALSVALFSLSTTLALIQLETKVCASVFSDLRINADVLRRIIATPLHTTIINITKIIEGFDGNFGVFLPLIKFFMRHENEICSLCDNIGEAVVFTRAESVLKQRGVQLISDFVDRLANDHNRFVPPDGNVHHVTSATLNFLRLLADNRSTIAYIYDESAAVSSRICLSKLFAKMLSALGINLRNKATTYSDNTLGALFMFNNLSYISMSCAREKSLMSILDASNGQLISFYQSEIDEYLNRYLQSWSKVTAILSDRRSVKFVYSNFNKEFDSIIDAQKNYCLVDISLAHDIRKRIKDLVLKPYVEFSTRNSKDIDLDRQQVKYDAESIELIIDRLFDVPY